MRRKAQEVRNPEVAHKLSRNLLPSPPKTRSKGDAMRSLPILVLCLVACSDLGGLRSVRKKAAKGSTTPSPTPGVTPAAPDNQIGALTFYIESVANKVQPTAAAKTLQTIALEGPLGGSEAVQIVVYSRAGSIGNVNLAATALSDGQGHSIGAEALT